MTGRWPVMFLVVMLAVALPAQSPTPRTYILTEISQATEVSLFSGRDSELKLYRDGSRELVLLTVAGWEGHPNAIRMSYLFDFAEHKVYMRNLAENHCEWMRYVSAGAPVNYDPITGTAIMLAQAGNQKPKIVGASTVAGMPVRIAELSSPEGTFRLWLAEKDNFALRGEIIMADGKRLTYWDVKEVRYDKPPASLLVSPSDCTTQAGGEWSDTEMHAHGEAQLSVPASSGGQATSAPAPGGDSGARIVRVWVHPDYFKGACPHQFTFYAGLQSTGPGEVRYSWIRSDGAGGAEQTISFSGPNQSRTIQSTWTLSGDPGKPDKQWQQLQLLSPNGAVSAKVPITLVCTP